MFKYLILLSLLFVTSLTQARPVVCTATLNSADEKMEFKHALGKQGYDFVELASPEENWFQKACDSGVKCDVLLISSHFSENFYGSKAATLKLSQLERLSCSRKCEGLLRHPQDVFLFGCNTLAGKALDNRTPPHYLEHLRDEGESLLDAQNLVETRYGPLGGAYADRFRLVFAGVPRIYGFDGPAPVGQDIAPLIRHYLEKSNNQLSSLKMISKNFPRFTQKAGIDSRVHLEQQLTCKITDDSVWISTRIEQLNSILSIDQLRNEIPVIRRFFRENPPQKYDNRERAALVSFQNNKVIKNNFLKILSEFTYSIPKLENAIFGLKMKWVSDEMFSAIRQQAVLEIIKESYYQGDSADLVCDSLKYDKRPLAVPQGKALDKLRTSKHGQRILGCLTQNPS